MKWILAQLNRPFFAWIAYFSDQGLLRMEICTFHSHLDRTMNFHTFLLTPWGTWDHKRPSGLLLQNGYHFTIDRWFIRPSLFALALSLSPGRHFRKKLAALHAMPCHHCWAGRYISRLRWREVADESRMNPIWGCTADWEWTQCQGGGGVESISQRWRHTCNGCCATHARSRAVVSSFVGLFGVSMNHRRKMTFIAGSKSALVGWLTNLLGNRWIHWWYGVHRLVFVGDWTLLIAITSLGCPLNFATCLTALVINYCWHLRMNPWNAVFISEDVEFYIFY